MATYLVETTAFVKTRANFYFYKINFYFYISQTKLSLDLIFYKVVYHHIIYMCDFFDEFKQLFVVIYMSFHKVVVCTRYVP